MEYRERKRLDHLRGYLFGSASVAVGVAMLVEAFCAGLGALLQPWLDDYKVYPITACERCTNTRCERAGRHFRSYDWVALGSFQI